MVNGFWSGVVSVGLALGFMKGSGGSGAASPVTACVLGWPTVSGGSGAFSGTSCLGFVNGSGGRGASSTTVLDGGLLVASVDSGEELEDDDDSPRGNTALLMVSGGRGAFKDLAFFLFLFDLGRLGLRPLSRTGRPRADQISSRMVLAKTSLRPMLACRLLWCSRPGRSWRRCRRSRLEHRPSAVWTLAESGHPYPHP